MARQVQHEGERKPHTTDEAGSLRRATLWSAAAILGVAVAGLLLAPELHFVRVVLLIFGASAVPQAFLHRR
jgi:hypothetical protein